MLACDLILMSKIYNSIPNRKSEYRFDMECMIWNLFQKCLYKIRE